MKDNGDGKGGNMTWGEILPGQAADTHCAHSVPDPGLGPVGTSALGGPSTEPCPWTRPVRPMTVLSLHSTGEVGWSGSGFPTTKPWAALELELSTIFSPLDIPSRFWQR